MRGSLKVLYLSSPIRQAPANVWEWSNGTYSLLLDTLELDFALDDDFAELLLDRSSTGAEDDERTLLLDFAELLLDFAELLDLAELLEATLDDERTLLLDTLVSLLLDCGVTLEEDFVELLLDFTLLLDSLLLEEDWRSPLEAGMTDDDDVVSSQSSHTDEEESSSRGAKLLSSSPHAVKESPATARNIAKETRKERLIYPPNAVLSQNTNENIT